MTSKISPALLKINESFLELYIQLPVEKITVQMIAQRAYVSRGIFYLHYQNIDDLLTRLELQQIEIIKGYNDTKRIQYYSNNAENFREFFVVVFKDMEDNLKIFQAIMGQRSRNQFKYLFRDLMLQNISHRFQNVSTLRSNQNITNTIIAIFTVLGSIGAITEWIMSEKPIPAEKFAELTSHIVLNGCFKIMDPDYH